MNNKSIFAIVAAILFTFTACKKEKASMPAARENPSLSILDNYEFDGTWKRKGYMLLDLNHDDNKDKKFMVVDIENASAGGYQFVIRRGPLPIDSLATNWPPQVKSVAFGYSNDMTVNAHMRMQVQSAPGGRFTYRYDSIYKFSSAILIYNYLNNPTLYAGTMAGKTPQGRANYWMGDAMGLSKPQDIIYYFKEGYFTNVISVGNGAKPLTTFVDGIPNLTDDWKKVDAILTLYGTYNTHFYFDFDKWQFFYTKDFCPSIWGAPCSGGLQYADYQSMNKLMNWPEGWGKK